MGPSLAHSPHPHTWGHYRAPPAGWRGAKTVFPVRQPTGSLRCCGREGWRGHQVQSPASKQSSPQGTARAAMALPWVASA